MKNFTIWQAYILMPYQFLCERGDLVPSMFPKAFSVQWISQVIIEFEYSISLVLSASIRLSDLVTAIRCIALQCIVCSITTDVNIIARLYPPVVLNDDWAWTITLAAHTIALLARQTAPSVWKLSLPLPSVEWTRSCSRVSRYIYTYVFDYEIHANIRLLSC